MSLWEYANPRKFEATTGPLVPWVLGLALVTLVTGLVWGFFFTPDERLQGASVKIFYIHVPSAISAINAWFMMLVASLIWLIRRHHVSALAAKAAAPIGMTFTALALVTGALWGQPTWGTWWVWDPQLTSFFVLFLFYLGYMALWAAIEDPDSAADLTSYLCMVGSVFAVLSRYAFAFWEQRQHQDVTMSLDAETNIANPLWYPAVVSLSGFVLLFIALVLIGTRTEIRWRRAAALTRRAQRSG